MYYHHHHFNDVFLVIKFVTIFSFQKREFVFSKRKTSQLITYKQNDRKKIEKMLETNKQASNNHNGKKKIDPNPKFGSIFSFVSRMQFVECIFIISSTEHFQNETKKQLNTGHAITTEKNLSFFSVIIRLEFNGTKKNPEFRC